MGLTGFRPSVNPIGLPAMEPAPAPTQAPRRKAPPARRAARCKLGCPRRERSARCPHERARWRKRAHRHPDGYKASCSDLSAQNRRGANAGHSRTMLRLRPRARVRATAALGDVLRGAAGVVEERGQRPAEWVRVRARRSSARRRRRRTHRGGCSPPTSGALASSSRSLLGRRARCLREIPIPPLGRWRRRCDRRSCPPYRTPVAQAFARPSR